MVQPAGALHSREFSKQLQNNEPSVREPCSSVMRTEARCPKENRALEASPPATRGSGLKTSSASS
jgi:hypothetical protein